MKSHRDLPGCGSDRTAAPPSHVPSRPLAGALLRLGGLLLTAALVIAALVIAALGMLADLLGGPSAGMGRQAAQLAALGAGLPLLQIRGRPSSDWPLIGKAIADRGLATIILLFLAPLMLIAAAAIKFESKGPVCIKRERYGFDNKPIKVWGFRFLQADRGGLACAARRSGKAPRMTRVGRFLYASGLAELPQLFNVLTGEMSLVGPPALLTKAEGQLFEEVVVRYAAHHNVKPGIAGSTQIIGWRNEVDSVEKIRMRVDLDLHYIDNWSFWSDCKILAKILLVRVSDENLR